MLNKLKLGTQFTLLISLVFLLIILLGGISFWKMANKEAEEDIITRAEILMQTMNSARNYTNTNIKPLIENHLSAKSTFMPEAIPAFAAREIFERFRESPEYHSFFYQNGSKNTPPLYRVGILATPKKTSRATASP